MLNCCYRYNIFNFFKKQRLSFSNESEIRENKFSLKVLLEFLIYKKLYCLYIKKNCIVDYQKIDILVNFILNDLVENVDSVKSFFKSNNLGLEEQDIYYELSHFKFLKKNESLYLNICKKLEVFFLINEDQSSIFKMNMEDTRQFINILNIHFKNKNFNSVNFIFIISYFIIYIFSKLLNIGKHYLNLTIDIDTDFVLEEDLNLNSSWISSYEVYSSFSDLYYKYIIFINYFINLNKNISYSSSIRIDLNNYLNNYLKKIIFYLLEEKSKDNVVIFNFDKNNINIGQTKELNYSDFKLKKDFLYNNNFVKQTDLFNQVKEISKVILDLINLLYLLVENHSSIKKLKKKKILLLLNDIFEDTQLLLQNFEEFFKKKDYERNLLNLKEILSFYSKNGDIHNLDFVKMVNYLKDIKNKISFLIKKNAIYYKVIKTISSKGGIIGIKEVIFFEKKGKINSYIFYSIFKKKKLALNFSIIDLFCRNSPYVILDNIHIKYFWKNTLDFYIIYNFSFLSIRFLLHSNDLNRAVPVFEFKEYPLQVITNILNQKLIIELERFNILYNYILEKLNITSADLEKKNFLYFDDILGKKQAQLTFSYIYKYVWFFCIKMQLLENNSYFFPIFFDFRLRLYFDSPICFTGSKIYRYIWKYEPYSVDCLNKILERYKSLLNEKKLNMIAIFINYDIQIFEKKFSLNYLNVDTEYYILAKYIVVQLLIKLYFIYNKKNNYKHNVNFMLNWSLDFINTKFKVNGDCDFNLYSFEEEVFLELLNISLYIKLIITNKKSWIFAKIIFNIDATASMIQQNTIIYGMSPKMIVLNFDGNKKDILHVSNVINFQSKDTFYDFYSVILCIIKSKEKNNLLFNEFNSLITRTLFKRLIMTITYGVTNYGAWLAFRKQFLIDLKSDCLRNNKNFQDSYNLVDWKRLKIFLSECYVLLKNEIELLFYKVSSDVWLEEQIKEFKKIENGVQIYVKKNEEEVGKKYNKVISQLKKRLVFKNFISNTQLSFFYSELEKKRYEVILKKIQRVGGVEIRIRKTYSMSVFKKKLNYAVFRRSLRANKAHSYDSEVVWLIFYNIKESNFFPIDLNLYTVHDAFFCPILSIAFINFMYNTIYDGDSIFCLN